MLGVRRDFLEKALSEAFRRLGRSLARSPALYIGLSVSISLALCSVLVIPFIPYEPFRALSERLHLLRYIDDPEHLFAPKESRAHHEASIIAALFPTNTSNNFDVARATRHEAFGRVIVEARNGSVLTNDVWQDVLQLDRLIRMIGIVITEDCGVSRPSSTTAQLAPLPLSSSSPSSSSEPRRASVFRRLATYADLCARDGGRCFANDFLPPLTKLMPALEVGTRKLDYPLHVATSKSGKKLFIPTGVVFGGAKLSDNSSSLLSARALSLFYYLEAETSINKLRAHQWESAFVDLLSELRLPNINIYYFTSRSLANELERNTLSIAPLLPITLSLMLLFTMVSCCVSGSGGGWHEAKPWVGLLSCVTVMLSVGAASGAMALVGVPLIGINLAAPFLMLGIGLDDTFVMLSAWRGTRSSLSVEERTGQMFAEAGVSITITSLTNVISFVIGTYGPFPSVYIFCVYTAACAAFTYVLQLMVVGSLIAVFGRLEAMRLHGLFCYHLPTPALQTSNELLQIERGSSAVATTAIGRTWLAAEMAKRDPQTRARFCFFGDVMAPWLCRKPVKAFVVALFVGYVLTALYGCSRLREGLDRARLTLDDSYAKDFFITDDKYFKSFPYRIQVVFNRPLNYTPSEVAELAAVIDDFESSKFVRNRALTECWFRDGSNPLKLRESLQSVVRHLTLGNLAEYLTAPEISGMRKDVRWANRSIVSSRCILQAHNVRDSNDEAAMMVELRAIADRHAAFNVTVFHPLFVFFDQFVLVRSTTAQSVVVAAVVMIAVALALLPSGWAVAWVALSIASIELGVVGFMTLWRVNLDSVSMINLIMCIGFSVDYSAHIAHAFLGGRATTADGRVAETLSALGLPVVQGAVSTLLGIVVLALAPSYIFLTFFKTVFLVVTFGALHALVFLPVFLSATHNAG